MWIRQIYVLKFPDMTKPECDQHNQYEEASRLLKDPATVLNGAMLVLGRELGGGPKDNEAVAIAELFAHPAIPWGLKWEFLLSKKT